MHKFEVIIKRDDEELVRFGTSQADLEIADKLGVSRHKFIEEMLKLKMENWLNENLSNCK